MKTDMYVHPFTEFIKEMILILTFAFH